MWEQVRRLCHGTEIGQQDMENKLLSEFEKFTSTLEESIESYYHQFCTLMNELTKNNLTSTNIVSNIMFINNLKDELGRYASIVNKTKDLRMVNFD